MPAHITFTKIDPENPVGYSKIWLDLLRQKYGFEGVVMSDCLSMAGADIGEMSARAMKALTAGCDMIIMANQKREVVRNVLETLAASFEPSVDSRLRIARYLGAMALDNKSKADIVSQDSPTSPAAVTFSDLGAAAKPAAAASHGPGPVASAAATAESLVVASPGVTDANAAADDKRKSAGDAGASLGAGSV